MNMKNWKTTIVGALLAIVVAVQPYAATGVFEWKQMIVPALIALLGYIAKDAGVTGEGK